MNKFLLAASAAAVAFGAQGANAATFLVGIPVVDAIPYVSGGAYNDFKPELNNLGLVAEAPGATVSINTTPAQTYITFEFLGSESWDSDSFVFNGTTLWTENSQLIESHFGQGLHAGDTAPINLGTINWNSALFPALFSSSNGSSAGPGQFGFTVFLPTGVGTGTYESNVIYFGFDDVPGGDDNHDDFIVRATIVSVPEPTTWALMVAGIAAVGFSMRRRSQNVRVAFS
jgi:hypothetical protein